VIVRHADDNEGDASSAPIYTKIAGIYYAMKPSRLPAPSSTCLSHRERLFVLDECQLEHVAHGHDMDTASCASEDVTEQLRVVAIV